MLPPKLNTHHTSKDLVESPGLRQMNSPGLSEISGNNTNNNPQKPTLYDNKGNRKSSFKVLDEEKKMNRGKSADIQSPFPRTLNQRVVVSDESMIVKKKT